MTTTAGESSRRPAASLPPQQEAIRARCVHPTGPWSAFPADAVRRSLVHRFQHVVEERPDHLALVTRNRALTYAELNALTNGYARAIAARGGGQDHPVAILVDDVALGVAAMLGALKAGRAYVPLDPTYPRARLEYMLDDSTARLLVTTSRLRNRLPWLDRTSIDVLELESIEPSRLPITPIGTPGSAALIIYTSGSTGHPKGVMHTHANVLHDVWHYSNSGHFCPSDRFVLLSSISFADSIRTIYSSLLNGATLCPFDVHADGVEPLAAWLTDQRITIYRSVPTLFRELVRSLAVEARFDHLRLIYLGGEPVRRSDVELYKRWFPRSCVLVNRCGSTEVLTYRSLFLDHESDVDSEVVPVGYEVPGREVVLLDSAGSAVGNGEVGEIGVRSRYISSGYWRAPELTRRAFETDREDPDVRIYRTGDLGRLRGDGCLEFLGRADRQVKIRGHRIEIAEIEAALLGLDGIRDVAVGIEHRGVDDRLVAWVVATSPAPSLRTMRDWLSARLPDFMVPSAYVMIARLPRLPNGKLNRAALPMPGRARPALAQPFAEPHDTASRDIAAVWREVLQLDAVGLDDDFLELGGDSLSAARVVTRVRALFGRTLPIERLWKASTVRAMTALMQHDDRPAPEDSRDARELE